MPPLYNVVLVLATGQSRFSTVANVLRDAHGIEGLWSVDPHPLRAEALDAFPAKLAIRARWRSQ
jgi:hypothetical protein